MKPTCWPTSASASSAPVGDPKRALLLIWVGLVLTHNCLGAVVGTAPEALLNSYSSPQEVRKELEDARKKVQQLEAILHRPILKNPSTLDDIRGNLKWLDAQYTNAQSYAEFESAVSAFVKKNTACAPEPPPPSYAAAEPKDPTAMTAEWLKTNTVIRTNGNWAALQDWVRTNASVRASSTTNETLLDHAVALSVAYAVYGNLSPQARCILLRDIGRSLSKDSYLKFRELVLFELTRIVWRERQRCGYLNTKFLDPSERAAAEAILGKQNSIYVPPEHFQSIALGLHAAAKDRGRGHGAALQIRSLTQLAPLEADKSLSPIVRLALGDAPPNTGRVGFFNFLLANPDDRKELEQDCRICFHEIVRVWDRKHDREIIAQQIRELRVWFFEITNRLEKLEQRMAAVETRVARLEDEVKRLWEAVRLLPEFTIEYEQLRKCKTDEKGNKLPRLAPSDLGPETEAALLRRLAPILLTDKGDASAPEDATTETFVSPKWLVEHCGVVRRGPNPLAPYVPAFDGGRDKNLLQLISLVSGHKEGEFFVNCDQTNTCRNGPAGRKGISMRQAIEKGEGVFGLVQKVGNTMYSVQYYVCFPYNAATFEELPFVGRFNHGGDWLCADLTVCLIGRDVENPLIVLGYLHNHGPVIEVEPAAMDLDNGHWKIYLEWGCQEPQPRPGGQGDRHTNVPGIRRNHRIENTGWGDLNEAIEKLSVRPHRGNGATNETAKTVNWNAKNLNSADPECQFIRAFQGAWGIEGDAPSSPYWNDKMKARLFEFKPAH